MATAAPQNEIELIPTNLSPEAQEEQRNKALGDVWQDDAFLPQTLPENTVVSPTQTPIYAPQEAVSGSLNTSEAVKATTVSSGNGNKGWAILGGALLLGGIGAAAAGGGGGKKSADKNDNTDKPNTTPPSEPTLSAPEISVDKVANIAQNNKNQIFTLSGSLKNDPNAVQTDVFVSVNGGAAQAAKVSGDKWTLDISGSDLAQKQGENALAISAVSHDKNGKTVYANNVLANYFVDTHIATPKVTLNEIADKLTTETQPITLSGSLNGVDADASAVVRVQINNGGMKTAKVSGNTWTLDVPASEMVGKLGANRVDVSAVATDKFGNSARHAASDVYDVIAPTETQIFYASGKMDSVSGSTAQAFDGKGLSDSGKILKTENEMLQRYMIAKGATTIEKNIEKAYAADRDKDGVIDAFDRNPNTWDVSERDLRMFASLAYEESEALIQGINEKNASAIQDLNMRNGLSSKSHSLNQVDLNQEVIGNWEVLKSEGNLSNISGLNYTIFGNGKTNQGTYTNIVVAFRGTQITSISDWMQGWKIKNGDLGADIDKLEEIANTIMKYSPKNVYSTGHSLGGYLAQFFAAYTMNQTKERADVFKHSALFNPAALKQTDNLLKDESELKEAVTTTQRFVRETYQDNSDKTNNEKSYKTNSYVIKGEWVSDGFPTIVNVGAEVVSFVKNPVKSIWNFFKNVFKGDDTPSGTSLSFYGLGTYENAQIFKFKSDDIWGKHDMTSFYENSRDELKQPFSKGYRMDKHYLSDDHDKDGLTDYQEKRIGTDFRTATNLNGKDTDQDGFSDHLEIKLGSKWQNADDIVEVRDFVAQNEWDSPILAVAATHTSDNAKTFLGATGYLLSPTAKGNDLSYTPNGETVDLSMLTQQDWDDWLLSGSQLYNGTNGDDDLTGADSLDNATRLLYGGAGNDSLHAGDVPVIMIGGAGEDTFKFKASNLLSDWQNVIVDFVQGDKLDFSASRELFSDRNANFKWSDVLGETATAFQNQSALIWQDDSKTLAYKSSQSNDLHTFARFDDSQTFASIQAGLIG